MKILVVDDEKPLRETIIAHLAAYPISCEIQEAEHGVEALEKIHEFSPDLVFLDIEMPELTGFEVLCHFPDRTFKVVIQTAYNQYAVRAFDANAIDYLLKPVSYRRFESCMAKVLTSGGGNQSIDHLVKTLSVSGMTLEHLTVGSPRKRKVIPVSDICYFESINRDVRLFTNDGDYTCDFTINQLEERFKDRRFIRLHRNNLACIDKVLSVSFTREKSWLTMADGKELKISRDHKATAKRLFGNKLAL